MKEKKLEKPFFPHIKIFLCYQLNVLNYLSGLGDQHAQGCGFNPQEHKKKGLEGTK